MSQEFLFSRYFQCNGNPATAINFHVSSEVIEYQYNVRKINTLTIVETSTFLH